MSTSPTGRRRPPAAAHNGDDPGARSTPRTGSLATDADGVRPVAVGTVVWLIAFVALLIQWDALVEGDREWWLWVCVAGFGLGLAGLGFTLRRRAAYRARGLQP